MTLSPALVAVDPCPPTTITFSEPGTDPPCPSRRRRVHRVVPLCRSVDARSPRDDVPTAPWRDSPAVHMEARQQRQMVRCNPGQVRSDRVALLKPAPAAPDSVQCQQGPARREAGKGRHLLEQLIDRQQAAALPAPFVEIAEQDDRLGAADDLVCRPNAPRNIGDLRAPLGPVRPKVCRDATHNRR